MTLGSLYQFVGKPGYSVWLTHVRHLRLKSSLLEDQIVSGSHTFYNPADLHGCVAELIYADPVYSIFWFPAQNSYTVMPPYWVEPLKDIT